MTHNTYPEFKLTTNEQLQPCKIYRYLHHLTNTSVYYVIINLSTIRSFTTNKNNRIVWKDEFNINLLNLKNTMAALTFQQIDINDPLVKTKQPIQEAYNLALTHLNFDDTLNDILK